MTRWITLVGAVALLAGCGGFAQETRPTVWLALEPALPQGGLLSGGPTVEVRRFAAVPPFDGDRVATRDGESRWGFAVYHRWAVPAGEMVAARLRDALGHLDLFSAVFTPPAPVDTDYRLSGAVRGLWWDRAARVAVVEIEASLTASPDRMKGFWVRRAEAPVHGETVEEFLTAGSAALSQAIAALCGDVRGAVGDGSAGGPMRLRGMYSYLADAASFTECRSGRRYPVVIEGDHAAVERGYAAARKDPGAPVLVTVSGRFVERAPEPGLPAREHLLIEKLDRFWPGGTCAGGSGRSTAN